MAEHEQKEKKNFIFTKPGVIVLTIITIFLVIGAVIAMDFGFGFGWFF